MTYMSRKDFFRMMRQRRCNITISGDWQWAIIDDHKRLIKVTSVEPVELKKEA